jgi:hypothetical protein
MKKFTVVLFFLGIFTITGIQAQSKVNPFDEEWTSLFNGKDLSGWDVKISGHPINDNYNETFRVEDGMIRIMYDKYTEFNNSFGHMYYNKPYSYYKLRYDYRFTGEQLKGGATWNVRNSGIMLHSQSAASNNINQTFPVSIELQLLGGLGKGKRTTANVCTPGPAVELRQILPIALIQFQKHTMAISGFMGKQL